MASPIESLSVDVLIVGAGPVGLTIGIQLLQFCPRTRIHIVEKHPKPAQDAFGRAVTFWPRSMEILDQIGLANAITQQCVAVRTSAAYDHEGNEVFGRGWSFLEGIEDTRYKFASVLRQKYVEEIMRGRLKGLGGDVQAPVEFVSLIVDESVEEGGLRVIATLQDLSAEHPREYEVRCRYLVGCDGSKTAVRGAAGIGSDGDRTEDKWVRIDGVLKSTTMPKPRSYGAIESPAYGNVLWIPLDHGATRIGFALNEERRKRYPELTREVFIEEAKLAVAPFEIEYERVDWASVYSVGQRVAKQFWTNGCVFLAGDACHTHSSGAGQGMNAGMHDAVNLGWKLSLVLQGIAKAEKLLGTYEDERRPNAQRLIRYDEDISVLVTGRLPKGWTGEEQDPHVVLGQILKEAKGFNTGLTIGFGKNLAVLQEESEMNGYGGSETVLIPAPAHPGFRAPDVKLLLPALFEPVWLQQLTPNRARFYVVVFVEDDDNAREQFRKFSREVDQSELLSMAVRRSVSTITRATYPSVFDDVKLSGSSPKENEFPVDFMTILQGTAANATHLLGRDPLGKVYFDGDGSAFKRYGVHEGVALILRPDGWIGARYSLRQEELAKRIEGYFTALLHT